MRILIVEDEKEMAEGIRGILQKAGYETDMAETVSLAWSSS